MLSWDANAAMENEWHQPGKAWINGDHPQEAASWLGTWVLGITPLLIGNHPVRITGWLAYVCWGIVGLAWWPESGGSDSGVSISVVHGLRCCGFLIIVARLAALCRPMVLTSWLGLAGVAIAGTMYLRWWLGDWLQVPSGVNRCMAIVLAVAVHLYWLREWMELTASPLAWLIYRIHHTGPGRPLIPWHGPLIVIANHAAWFDPFWLGKVIPRRLTPMMTSDFYDLPGLYWLMRYVLRVIRVEEAHARREAPELDEAVARLDAGECLVIFPEGRLRREEHRHLAPFQRGIWLILQKRPATPVVPCWIEGNWGSFFSWKDGPPMKNKPFDWGRRILVVVGEPIFVPSEILNDHRTTRRYLEEAVLRLRPTTDSQHSPSATLSNRSASPAEPSPSRVEQAPEGNGDDGNGDKVH
jgi:1-acyl-sn-glycerol-3-phosphate acyltransferase